MGPLLTLFALWTKYHHALLFDNERRDSYALKITHDHLGHRILVSPR